MIIYAGGKGSSYVRANKRLNSKRKKEQIKNSLKSSAAVFGTTVLAGDIIRRGLIPGSKAAGIFAKAGNAAGKAVSKFGSKTVYGKVFPWISKLGEKILKNPAKAGVAGFAVFTALALIGLLERSNIKAGCINQKYEDAAKAEAGVKIA